jgi:hypothetical protein
MQQSQQVGVDVELFYFKVGEAKWYFSDISRKSLIEQGMRTLIAFMATKPSPEEFSNNVIIQNILSEVPECSLAYQKHLRDNIDLNGPHTPVPYTPVSYFN